MEGLAKDFIPLQLRTTGRTLFLWGRAGNARQVYAWREGKWQPASSSSDDILRQITAVPGGFRAVTAAGLQRYSMNGGQISRRQPELTDSPVIALRTGSDGAWYAKAETGQYWRETQKGWETTFSLNQHNPFTFPVRQAITTVLSWERRYAIDGDCYQVLAGGEPVNIVSGKLVTDYIIDAAQLNGRYWQATLLGLQKSVKSTKMPSQIIPWPAQVSDQSAVALAIDAGQPRIIEPNGCPGMTESDFEG